MFFNKTEITPQDIDVAIATAHSRLTEFNPESDEYKAIIERLDTLYKCKTLIGPQRLSPDAILGAVANIAGIIAILNFEKVGVITTKALGFVMKNKI